MELTGAAAAMPCCLFSAVLGLVGAGIAYSGVKEYLLVQKIKNTPTSKVRSAAAGLVELFGKAAKKEELSSPVTRKPCVLWKVLAEYRYKKKHGHGWRKFFSDGSKERFFLDDGTGRMLVDPLGAEVRVKPDFRFTGKLSDRQFFGLLPAKQLDKKVLDYLEENPKAKKAFERERHRTIRMREYIVEERDKVYVLGTASPLEGAGSDVAHRNLVVKKDNIDRIMFIADSKEEQVALSMGIKSWVSMFIGLMLLLGSMLGGLLMLMHLNSFA
ncbi:hypothetical protein GF318_03495 [Candidatus Micrarchaeota archaeon]|nr:hypothetical protein [Candidatus Micrarchaeota archaeon]